MTETFDVAIIGGGPAGATAAHDLARRGRRVLLLDRAGRIKPCGGAIPPRAIKDFDLPDHLLVAKARSARMVAPSGKQVDIPIEGGFVGLVDREHFDEWLRERAASAGAIRRNGKFERLGRDADGCATITYVSGDPAGSDDRDDRDDRDDHRGQNSNADGSQRCVVRARAVIGADGARSAVAQQAVPGADKTNYVFAYHEIVRAPDVKPAGYDGSRCDVFYQGHLSPDFYGWVFPHGDTLSIGTGSADKGFSLRNATSTLRTAVGLQNAITVRREGAPLPMKPLRRWDNGRDVVLAGDAAGVVAPSSGEGIYYAMAGGRLAADAVEQLLATGDARCLANARRDFMRAHGKVFWVLGIMQRFWYANDRRRERFVAMCRDKDVQKLTFDAYMNKELVRRRPLAHIKIFFKDMAHLLGLAKV